VRRERFVSEHRSKELGRPALAITSHRDGFGNWCNRVLAPSGRVVISANGVVNDSGEADPLNEVAGQIPLQLLPAETLVFLLGSRYCETDRLSELAWKLFGQTPLGWPRVQADSDFVHRHIQFGYEHASATKTAWEVFHEPRGVCRDFAHLAVALCRALNIPARYCTGYLGDIGEPPPYAPMDFRSEQAVRFSRVDGRENQPKLTCGSIERRRSAAVRFRAKSAFRAHFVTCRRRK
jgi:transglutaminase-like putative cysteine protease